MSEFLEEGKLWFSGKMIDWRDAKIHVMSHVLHYGSSVFEGFRCYKTVNGPALFRLQDHIRRLFDSAKIYRMEIPYSPNIIEQACADVVKINNLEDAYMRPIVFRGYGSLGVDPSGCPIEVAVAALTWGKYLGREAINNGVDVRISSWARMRSNTLPAMSKSGANYMNSQLINLEAKVDGYVEGIALDSSGLVSEGSGENVFVVRDGIVHTPPFSSSVLPGLTRDCVMQIAASLGYEVKETPLPREALYIADEVFFTGSAAEVTPVKSIDKIPIGKGTRGPITEKIQQNFFGIITGELEDRYNWLTFI
ncbi:branched-chain amino acid transaminase [bacterium]|nr:branched-chain amino acid transaminase [bacterium]